MPVFPSNDQPFLILWLNSYPFFKITVTSALPRDGTLATPMIQATGYCVTHMEYGWCPLECIPFALETKYLTRPHMINLVEDPPLACYMVIKLRVCYLSTNRKRRKEKSRKLDGRSQMERVQLLLSAHNSNLTESEMTNQKGNLREITG